MDPSTKKENLNRMYDEGKEVASKLLKLVNQKVNEDITFKELQPQDRMKYIKEKEPYRSASLNFLKWLRDNYKNEIIIHLKPETKG